MRLTSACRLVALAIALVPAAGFSQTPAKPDTIWGLLSEMLTQPLEQESLNRLMGVEPDNFSPESFGMQANWAEKSLADGVRVKPSLITWNNGKGTDVHMPISGRCIKLPEIEANYPETKLIALPTHGYPDAVLTYTAGYSRGKVAFYANAHTRCLSTVKITPDASHR